MPYWKTDCNTKLKTGVIVTPGFANALGVVRSFGRRGIPVIYLDSARAYFTNSSRYIRGHLRFPSPDESESEFIEALLNFGKQLDNKMVIIPTTDPYVLCLSKHKRELQQFYLMPVPDYDTVLAMLNKKKFYKLLVRMKVPHPDTYFPDDIAELKLMGKEVGYPYIIKPVYSWLFQRRFRSRKCFLINSEKELDCAIDKLKDEDMELLIQKIIPGRGSYEFYTYFNKRSEPLAVGGWDRLREYPPYFGLASFCRSSLHPPAIESGLKLLRSLRYHGFAAPDLKLDPRDGEYKLLEVNPRTSLQNRLPAACGADIEYIAYLDLIGGPVEPDTAYHVNLFWVEDFIDLFNCCLYIGRREASGSEIIELLKVRKIHSIAAWDDPVPFIRRMFGLSIGVLKLLLRTVKRMSQGKHN